jgi:outer membrane protein assembly factor BamB
MTRLCTFALCLVFASTAAAEDWLHWRGPLGTGVSSSENLPDEWSPDGKNVLWKAPLGCRSTPLVSRGKVYIIGSVGEGVHEQEGVTCFDAETGKQLWQHRFNVFLADIVTNRVGWANLAADAETGNIYAHGVQGLFFCFDEHGKILWEKSMTEEYGRITGYGGRVTSPIVVDDLVIFHMLNASWGDLGRGGHRFMAMDKKTGAIRWWSTPGGQPMDTIYSCAIVASINGQRLLVCGGADGWLHAIKAATGERVWSFPITKRGCNVSPVADEAKGLIYMCQSEENIASNVPETPNAQGLVVCLDATKVKDGRPAVVWKRLQLLVGYASPLLHDGRLYVCDNGAKMFCLDAATGKTLWDLKYGRAAKGSPVWADGKIFVCEVGSKWHTIRPGHDKAEIINTARFIRPDGLVVECNGSAAVANGRIYLTTQDETYCIGTPDGRRVPAPPPATLPAASTQAPALAQLHPADVTLHPGGSAEFTPVLFDALGSRAPGVAGEWQVDWTLPAMPPPGSPAGGALIPPLKGAINKDGKLTVPADVPAQSGVVQANVKIGGKEFIARARVRVAPTIPYEQDFSKIEVNRIPTGWINLAGKFAVVELPDKTKALKKLATNPNPLVARANAYITQADASNYTISADLMGTEKDAGTGKFLPDMGLVNCRYTLTLDGNKQTLMLRTWEANKTDPRSQVGGRVSKAMPFPWKPSVWYSFKLQVQPGGDNAVVRGKVWERGAPEPSQWTLEMEDPCPNTRGAAAIFGNSTGIPPDGSTPGCEIFYQNVKVVPNK